MLKGSVCVLLGLHAGLVWLSLYPWWQWQWALLAHFQVQYLLLSVLLTVLALTFGPRHHKKLQLMVGITGLIAVAPGLWLVSPYILPASLFAPRTNQVPTTQTLTLLHTNVFAGNRQIEKVAGLIAARQPDVVVLMEYTENLRQQLEKAPAVGEYPYRWTGQAHLGVYSKYPLTSELRFIGWRSIANKAQLHTWIDLGEQRLHLVVAHPPWPIGAENFAAQQAHFVHWQERFANPVEPVLIVGDFNTTPWSSHFRQLITSTPLQDSQRGYGIRGTWPLFFSPWGYQDFASRLGGALSLAQIPIDHVLHTPDVRIMDWQRPESVGSDHWPVFVKLSL